MWKEVLILLGLLGALTHGAALCVDHFNCNSCQSGCSWCGMTINSETTTLGKCLETTETCNDSTANTVFPRFDDLLTKQFTGVQLTMGAKPIATADCPAGADPVDSLMFSGKSCAQCGSGTFWCTMALYDRLSDSDYCAHRWCVEDAGNCSPKIFEAQLPREVEPAAKVAIANSTTCDAPGSVPVACSSLRDWYPCNYSLSNCQFCTAYTAGVAAPNFSRKLLYGGFCRGKGAPCEKVEKELDGMRKFADASSKTILTVSPTISYINPQTDKLVFNPALQTFETCNAHGGSWCATTVGGDTSTKGGACLEDFNATNNCAAFHDSTKDFGLVSEIQITPDPSTAAPDSSTTAPEPETTTSRAESAASVSLFVFMTLFTVTAI